ncbi:alcohol dehydrogenase [Fusarium mexicanum]|uniref:Alcohol dehydrogenase n=1 Tax=Fusarium mexicanum TaxID=751941 RepID=A0A8H5J5A4_9HYPO|nr:alcohol dehydrogenase [Fusarium mexicanum]
MSAKELPPHLKQSVEASKCEYRNLGKSGLRISVPVFGCMSFGDKRVLPWVIGEDEALELLKAAYDRGLNTWDTANTYSNGASEEIVGKALKKFNIPRHKVVILSKCRWGVGEEPGARHINFKDEFAISKDYQNQYGLSRTAIFNQVNASLARLDTDYIDLLQIHRFDDDTPLEETMKALHDLVQSGKVRYIGASSMWATQFARMQFVAEKNNWTKFISMQNHYNLLYREEEREMIRFCNDTGVGIIPWAPLCRGHLARPPAQFGATERSREEKEGSGELSETDQRIIGRVVEIAGKHDWPMAHVALAWINQRVTSPIIGFSSVERIEQAIGAKGKKLSDEEVNPAINVTVALKPAQARRTYQLNAILTMSSSIPSTQKAALIENPGNDARIVIRSDIPVANPQENEILVKLEFTGLCGSEIRALSGWGPYNPIVGHEGVGTVVKLGKEVDAGLLGKRVGVKWLYSACGTCTICKRGYANNCPKQLNTGKHVPGTLQEYMIADARYVTEIPDGLAAEVAAPLLCAGLTMAGAVSKLTGYAERGDWVVISGSGGGLGHLGVQIASRLNGLRVIAVDNGEPKRKLSLDSGAKHFIDFASENVEERVKEITGDGASAVLVVTGSQEAFIQAPSLVRNMGIIVTIGLPRNDFNIPLSATICSARSLTVTGVAVGTEEQIKELLQHAVEGTIAPEVMVLEFEEVGNVIEGLKRQEVTGRVVVRIP